MADFSQELKKDFLDEAFDLLDNLEKSLLALEKNPTDDKAINEVFRVAHTVKGGAGTVGFTEILELTHILEDVLDMARKKTLSLGSEDISLLLQSRDELEKMLNARAADTVHVSEAQETVKKDVLAKIGSQATVTFRVDPAILGGLVVRVGDKVLDGSVSGQLETLRQSLK